ncbi:MAG: helix-turn-helix domain-containing protein [Thermoplasmata archaeon]
MIMATRLKLYPNEKQKVLLEKHFGSCIFVYNHFFEERERYYITQKDAEKSSLNYINTQNMLVELKKEYPWLYDVNSQSLQLSLRFLGNAFKNIRMMGLIKVGLVQSESTPVEIATSGLYGIYSYRQMSVYESGSSDALAEE